MHVNACEGRKRMSEPLNLALQEVVSYLWVVGTELWALHCSSVDFQSTRCLLNPGSSSLCLTGSACHGGRRKLVANLPEVWLDIF